jgi:hypothetical protein
VNARLHWVYKVSPPPYFQPPMVERTKVKWPSGKANNLLTWSPTHISLFTHSIECQFDSSTKPKKQ